METAVCESFNVRFDFRHLDSGRRRDEPTAVGQILTKDFRMTEFIRLGS